MSRRLIVAVAAMTASLLGVSGLPPVLVAAPAADAAECTIKWYAAAGNPNWHDADNWNLERIPVGSDVVCIEDGYHVVHSTGATTVAALQVNGELSVDGGSLAVGGTSHVYQLIVSGGSLSPMGELTVTHELQWVGGTVAGQGPGALVIGTGATGSVGDPGTKVLTGTLRNEGSLVWSGGSLQMATGNDPHLDNHGTLEMQGAVSSSSSGEDLPRFTNRPGATIVKTGVGEAVLGDQQATLVNEGTVVVSGGTLWVDMWLDGFSGADLNQGTWDVADGATLKLHAADDLSINSADITLRGPEAHLLDGSGNDALSGLATNAGSLTLSGGRDLAVSGQFANDGTLSLGAGSELSVVGDFYAGNGRIELAVAGTAISDGYGRITAGGTAWLGGTVVGEVVAPFVPAPEDQFEVITATSLSDSVAAVEGSLFVSYDRAGGRVLLTASEPFPGCTTAFVGGRSLLWNDPLNWSSGEVPSGDDTACIPEGATVHHDSGGSTVNSLRGAGRLEVLGGSISMTGESSLAEVNLAGGTLTGDGLFTITERFDWSAGTLSGAGSIVVASSATAYVTTGSGKILDRHLRNNGAMAWSGGSIAIRTDLGGVAQLDNAGTLAVTGAVTASWSDGATPPLLTNSGLLGLASGASLTHQGDFEQTPTGRFEVEVAGTIAGVGFGQLLASGSATLAGTIASTLASGFVPSSTDEFPVIDATTLAGSFSSVEGPLGVTYDSGPAQVVLSVGGSPASCNVEWDGSAGNGRWDTAANWSTDSLPGPTDWVCIPEGSTAEHSTGTSAVAAATVQGTLRVSGGSLTISGESSIMQLKLVGGTLDGDAGFTVQDQFVWSGGTLAGAGVLTLASGASGSVSGYPYLARHLRNEGTLVWQSGNIYLSEASGGVAHLDNNAVFEIRDASSAYWISGATRPVITNQPGATITKTTTGTTTLGSNGSELINNGTVRAMAGLLRVGGGVNSGGSGTWVADQNLSLHQGTWALSGSVTGSGEFSVTGAAARFTGSPQIDPAKLSVTSGSLDLDNDTDGGNTTGTLSFSGGTLDGDADLTVTQSFAWSGGTLAGAGVLTLASGASGSVSGYPYLARHLRNEGTLVWQSGNIYLSEASGGVAHLDNNAVFEIRDASSAYWISGATRPVITNQPGATITKTTTGTTTLGSNGSELINNGTVRAMAGLLRVGGGVNSGGSGTWVADQNLSLHQGTWALSGSVTGSGEFSVTGAAARFTGSPQIDPAKLSVTSGSLDLDNDTDGGNTTGTLSFSGGTLDGDADLTVTQSFAWSGGTLAGAGVLTLASGASGSVSGYPYLARHLRNEGTLVWQSGNIYLSEASGGVAHLDNNAVFEIRDASSAYWISGATRPVITNQPGATITKTTTGTTTLGSNGSELINNGTVRAMAGLLRVGGGVNSGGSGTWVADQNLSLHQGTWALSGSVTGSGEFSVTGAAARFTGSPQIDPAKLSVTSGSLDLDNDTDGGNTTGTLSFSGGTLDGDADLTVTQSFAWSGGTLAGAGVLTLASGASGSVSGYPYLARHLRNEGTLVWQSGNIYLSEASGGVAHLDNNAVFEIRDASSAYWISGATRPVITNQPGATITKTTTGTTTLGSNGSELINNGTIAVGSSSTLNAGSTFTQGATGRLQVAIAGTTPGTTHGRLLVPGAATLAGTIATTFEGGYTPADYDEFLVFDAATLSGTFATVDSPLVPRYDTAAGTVTLVKDEFVPVPPTVSVLPQSAIEGSGTFLVEVRGVGGNVPDVVPVQVTEGTATTPADYTTDFTPTTVAILPDGISYVPVTLEADQLDEDDETFTVVVGGVAATMTILDDDLPPKVVIDGLSITEGDEGSVDAALAVRLVDPVFGLTPQASGRAVTVGADTRDGTAQAGPDYVATSGTVVFDPGETTKTFVVPVLGDQIDEPDEQFTATLGAPLNAIVPEGEDATVTIVDDDPGGSAAVRQELETGGAALFDLLDEWGAEFDLDRTAPSPFELPGLTDELASLFEPQDDLDALDSPFSGLDDDLATLCGQLEARGLGLDWVEGGVCGNPAPPTDADIIQVRYTARLSELAEALGFTGDELNDDAEGILDGLVADLGLDADFDSSADLVVTLVMGVDETGFYVADESGLRLEVGATAAVSGTGGVGGVDGLDLEGPATVDVAVLLGANGGPARLRAAELAAPPTSYLRPAAEGSVDLHLDATLDPVALSWDSTFTLAIDPDFSTEITVDARLEGVLALPGLTEAGQPASIELVGTFDGTTWTLTGEGASGAEYALAGFDVDELGFEVVLSPDTFAGTATAALHSDFGDGSHPVDFALTASFDHTAFGAEGHLALGDVTLGADPALAWLRNVALAASFDGDIAADTLAGGITVAADAVVLSPQPTTGGGDPEGAARAENISGTLTSDGRLALHAGSLSASIGDAIDISATGVDLTLGSGATDPVLTIPFATATVPSLNGLGVTFTDLHLNRDGTWGAGDIDVTSGGLLQTIGLGGIVPFDITGVSLAFPDHEDLDAFEVTVTGSIDFAAMGALPFTPLIGIGGPAVSPTSPPEENLFTFSVAVESLSEGRVRPLDLGPITLGFDDLVVSDVTLGAQLTLGGYQDGVWVGDACGSLAVLAGLDDLQGEATIDVCGSLDVTAGGASLDLDGTFSLSAALGDDVSIEGAQLAFGLGIAVDSEFAFTITGPTFEGLGVDRIAVAFGDFMRLVGTGVDIDFSPEPGEPLVAFGGTVGDGSLAVEFDDADAFSGWGGEAGNLGIAADGTVLLLPGFFVDITVPDDTHFGLPDWLPLRVDEVGIRFPDVDLAQLPPEGLPIEDLANFAVRISGGLEATEAWPIAATVDGLEVDLGALSRGEFPITNLDGFEMGMEPFELVPGFRVGGGLELGTVEVDGDPAPGEQSEDVFYGRVFGEFSYEGMGAGIDLVVSQYGPVLAQLQVPLAIPIDGGALGGVMLSSVEGGINFGGPAFPDPERPLEILHDPAFDTDVPINDDTIRASVEPAVQQGNLTWDQGFTLAMSGNLTHALAPGIVTGDVTLGANIGLIPGQQGLKLIGTGDISVWDMSYAGAALLMDLADPLNPSFDFAFETPQAGNPLSFLMPAQAELEASLDTTGMLAGFGLGAATFVDRLAAGTLEVGQGFFDATLDALAADLQAHHDRPLARLVLDSNRDGFVSASEDQAVIDRNLVLTGVTGWLGTGPGGLPGDPLGAASAARVFVTDLLVSAQDVLADSGSFDLADVFAKPDYVAFAQLLGAGNEAVAALLGVMRDAVVEAGDVFMSQFDPSFHLRGALQPIILGIPFGEPTHEVELIITKDGLGFGFDTSVGDLTQRVADAVVPFIGGAVLQTMQLGLEDHLGMTVELPIGGVVEGLFDGSGLPTIDPMSGDWAIELRGGLRWFDFEVGQMTGLVIAAGNQAYLDAHVQKLYENPDAPLDPSRIPIQSAEHYDDLLTYGGLLLNGRLLLPELLTDPVGLLGSLDLQVPENPLEMPRWVSAVADDLTRIVQPATVQLYLPSFASVLLADYDAPTEAERLRPIGSGRALADAVNEVFDAAYLEGTFDGTLLSIPFGKALVESGAGKLAVEGEIPLIGLRSRFELDVNPTLGTDGPVDLPRAIATVAIDEADLDAVLTGLGLPPVIGAVAGVDATLRAVSPGYDPASTDPLLRTGGIELAARLGIEGLVDRANFRLAITPPTTAGLPDLVGHAQVGRVGLAGVELRNASVDIVQQDGALSIGLDGTARILGARAHVHGELNPDLTGTLAVEFDSGGPQLAGFDLRAGWELTVTRVDGELVSTFAYDGEVGLPEWLSTAAGQGSVHATGSVSSDGAIDLALEIESLNLFGFNMHDGTFRVVGDARSARMDLDALTSLLGAELRTTGSLSLGRRGPSGSLALSFETGNALAFGPVSVEGALSMTVSPRAASIAVTGTADVPGVADDLGITGSIAGDGTGSLALTGTSLGLKGFSLTRRSGNPAPPLASITRTSSATTMTVDARFNFLGSVLDVDGDLSLSASGPTGSLALTYGGSVNIPFGGFTFEGGVAMAISPTGGSIAVSSRIDIAGLASNLTTTGSLDSTLRGSLTVSAGSLVLGPPGSPFSISGSFSLSRLGSPAVISLTASNVSLDWAGVSAFTVNTFSIGSDGHFDATVTGRTIQISEFSWALPNFNLHVGAAGTGVQLQLGSSSLSITGIGTLTIPGFDVDTTGDFSVILASTSITMSALTLNGKLIFERRSGVFRLRVTGTNRTTPARFAIPGFASINVDDFTISSNGTFSVAASTTRLGPDALSIRNASIRVRKTGTSLSTLEVRVVGGDLYLPVGDPIDLPTITIDGDAEWSHTFTASGLDLGPALRTSNNPSFTLSLSGGVLALDLDSTLYVSVLADSIDMRLRELHVDSAGAFEGNVRGRLSALGYLFAVATLDVSLSNGVVRMRIPSSDPVSVDLGPVSGSVYGSVYSDGDFSFSGSAAVDLTLIGVGLRGTASVQLRNRGLSGSFTGEACVGVCIDVVGGSISRNGVLTLRIAGVRYRIQLFDEPS